MSRIPLAGRSKGRPRGGPLLLAVLALTACAAALPVPDMEPPPAGSALDVYRESGMITGSGAFPAVASFVVLAGPADSTLLLVGLSLPSSALRFTREGDGFVAGYGVALELTTTDSLRRQRQEWRENVRVGSFAETTRTDESVVFQQSIVLTPGRYVAVLTAGDRNSTRGFRATDTLDIPAFMDDARSLSAPAIVYRSDGRSHRDAPPEILLNPRRTVAYGGESPRIYIESYATHSAEAAVRIRDAAEAIVWETVTTPGPDSAGLRHATVVIPADDLPLGRLTVEVERAGDAPQRTPLLVTVSDQWMVANYEEVLQVVAYIAGEQELDSLRAGDAPQRRRQWDRFWEARDPFPATPGNEYREEFFARIRAATLQFSEPGGRPGWQTARGEVYIVLGPPDRVVERYLGRSDMGLQPSALEWLYSAAVGRRLSLLFIDRTGLGRFELDAASLASFRAAAERLVPRRS